jgi:glutathione S-transferase
MQLFYAPGTISVAVALALHEAGLEHTLVKVDFSKGEQMGAEYLGINPKGRVPALVVEDSILTETGAILEYIASVAPEKNLVPSDPVEAAKMRSVMYYVASTMHVNHAHRMRGKRWASEQSSFDDMKAKVPETMTASAEFVENECLTGPFISDAFSIGDCYLFAVCKWLKGDGVDMVKFPKINAFIAAVDSRDSVRSARAGGVLK